MTLTPAHKLEVVAGTDRPASPQLEGALFMVRRGFHLFRVKPDAKDPYRTGINEATTDEATIRRWHAENPNLNFGVCADRGPVKVIIDHDAKFGAHWKDEALKLYPDRSEMTFSVWTGTNGLHTYWNADEAYGQAPLDSTIDVRSRNGYGLAPGSIVNGKLYRIAKDLPVARLPEVVRRKLNAAVTADTGTAETLPPLVKMDQPETVQWARHMLETTDGQVEPGRNKRLYGLSLDLKHRGISQELAEELLQEIWVPKCTGDSEFTDEEIAKTIWSAYRRNDGRAPGCMHPDVEFEDISATVDEVKAAAAAKAPRAKITATPYRLPDAAKIPSRDCLDGGHRFRKFLSATVAPGGVGKTALVIAEVLELVTGRALLGDTARRRCRVWFWCGEDPRDELDRRIAAACLHYGIKAEDLDGWLFVDTGREQKIIIATETTNGVKIAEPLVEEITATIRANKIDLLIVDPFVSSHEVNENDNTKINKVARVYADRIADPCNCAVELIHHVRKGNGGEVTADDARGASALKDAARSVRAINAMTEEQWAKAGVTHNRKRYFRIDDTGGKQSMMPPADASTWYHLESVPLGNPTDGRPGDKVGVVVRWHYPDATDGLPADALDRVKAKIASVAGWRADVRSKDYWVGKAVALALGLNLDDAAQLEKTKRLLRDWFAAGELIEVERVDEHRKSRKFVEVNPAKTKAVSRGYTPTNPEDDGFEIIG